MRIPYKPSDIKDYENEDLDYDEDAILSLEGKNKFERDVQIAKDNIGYETPVDNDPEFNEAFDGGLDVNEPKTPSAEAGVLKPDYLSHRKRCKETFADGGIEGWKDYIVLEMMLFYVIKRGDTKPIAKALIKAFGSLQEVINAEPEQLQKIKGVGPETALFLSFFRAVSIRYLASASQLKRYIGTSDDCVDYFTSLYAGKKCEEVYALFLDDNLYYKNCLPISMGIKDSVKPDITKIIDLARINNSRNIILAHNHPNGVCTPSSEDINTTNDFIMTLRFVDICLLDHVIVGNNGTFSLKCGGYMGEKNKR